MRKTIYIYLSLTCFLFINSLTTIYSKTIISSSPGMSCRSWVSKVPAEFSLNSISRKIFASQLGLILKGRAYVKIVRVVFSRTFLVHVWRKCRGADCFCRQMFIPRRALICFARSVPRGRSLNTVAFAGNSFYSIRALQLYITVLKP